MMNTIGALNREKVQRKCFPQDIYKKMKCFVFLVSNKILTTLEYNLYRNKTADISKIRFNFFPI